jgi:hypothetical protein
MLQQSRQGGRRCSAGDSRCSVQNVALFSSSDTGEIDIARSIRMGLPCMVVAQLSDIARYLI